MGKEHDKLSFTITKEMKKEIKACYIIFSVFYSVCQNLLSAYFYKPDNFVRVYKEIVNFKLY
jgi:hypothetical protein